MKKMICVVLALALSVVCLSVGLFAAEEAPDSAVAPIGEEASAPAAPVAQEAPTPARSSMDRLFFSSICRADHYAHVCQLSEVNKFHRVQIGRALMKQRIVFHAEHMQRSLIRILVTLPLVEERLLPV